MKLLVDKSYKLDDFTVYITLIKLYKSYLLFVSDQEELGIGNVTLGTPSTVEGIKSPTASYKLFGMNNKLISTIIAEKVSKVLNAPVLLLIFMRTNKNEEKILKPIVKIINEILEDLTIEE